MAHRHGKQVISVGHKTGVAAATARLGGWALTDQALSSGTNAALSVAAAHVSGAADFGAFALAFSAYLLALGIAQSITTSPLNLRFATASYRERLKQMPACLGLSLAVGLAAGFVCVLVGLATDGTSRGCWLGLAACLPGALMQAMWRNQSFIDRNPRLAAACDALWAGVQTIGFAALFVLTDHVSIAELELLWGLGATTSAFAFCAHFRRWPSMRGGARYLRAHIDISRNTSGEYLTVTGATQAVPYLIAGIGSLAQAGVFRAAQLAIGFANLPLQGVGPLVATTAVRLRARRSHLFRPLLIAASTGGSGLIAAYLGLLLAIPSAWGRALIGSLWNPARPLLIPLALVAIGQWVTTVAMKGLYARQSVATAFLLRVVITAISLPALAFGVAYGGLEGAAWTLAATSPVGAALGWLVLLNDPEPADSAHLPPADLRPV